MNIDWSLPYPSQREPVFAANTVATSQPLAAQAGLDMLKRGGNAVDAAVATAIALTVVEPNVNGIGADAFALVWAGGGLHGLNGSGRSPRALTPDRFAGETSIPTRGWGGVTVPGAVSLWVALSEQYGALPFGDLFEPAIRYARDGYQVAPQCANGWARAARAYRGMAPWQATFCPAGRAPRPGERFVSPDHARTLARIAATKGDAFYRGDLAEAIAEHAASDGGLITRADLAEHEAMWVRPVSQAYRGLTLHEIPPNGQGIIALIALGILQHLDVAAHAPDTAESIHLQVEAMRLAFADGSRHVADPDAMEVTTAGLLDPGYLAARARTVDPARRIDAAPGVFLPGGTVYLTAADAEGTMVSLIQSNYTGFGSGIVVPGTGIALQNRGCCFTLEDGHPNQVGPAKRPYHTIIPGFATEGDEPRMSFGVMGGYMQPQGHAQVMSRMVDHGQNPQAALDAPRWQVMRDGTLSVEPGFDPAVYEGLRNRGHDVRIARARTVSHGGGQAILRLDDGYAAASDLRRDGQAVGF